jgi:hypothetical protein
MTDPPPTDQDLELVSAYLDGEATPAERARVEADPALLARVDELRTVAGAVGAGFTPLADDQAASQRRRAIAAGLAPPAPPMRARRRTPLPSPLAAAAVIVVIALVGLWLVASAGGGSDADKADSAASAARPEATTSGASTTSAAATSQSKTVTLPDLGSFPTRAALTAALERTDVTTLGSASGTTADTERAAAISVDRCQAAVDAGQAELGDRLAVATARLDGRPVYVISQPVRGKNPPVTQLTVVDQETCNVLFGIQR